MKARASRTFVLTLCLLLAGALAWKLLAPDAIGGSSLAAPEERTASVIRADGLLIEAGTGGQPVQALKEGTMTVSITEPDGSPVTGAELEMVVDMKNMNHPLPAIALSETSPGVYEGRFVPVMAGKWIAELKAAVQGQTVSFSHDFTVKR